MRKCEYVLINSKNSWNCSTICKKKDDILVDNQNRKGEIHSSTTLGWWSQTCYLGRHYASFGPNNTLGRRWAWACLGSPDDSRRLLAEEERNGERRRARRADGRRVAAHELDTAELPRALHRHRRRRRASCDAMAPEPDDDLLNEKNPRPLDEDDIALLKTYVSAPGPDRSPSSLPSVVAFVNLELVHG